MVALPMKVLLKVEQGRTGFNPVETLPCKNLKKQLPKEMTKKLPAEI